MSEERLVAALQEMPDEEEEYGTAPGTRSVPKYSGFSSIFC